MPRRGMVQGLNRTSLPNESCATFLCKCKAVSNEAPTLFEDGCSCFTAFQTWLAARRSVVFFGGGHHSVTARGRYCMTAFIGRRVWDASPREFLDEL